MNRRTLLQAVAAGAASAPALALSQSTPVAAYRDLVTHTVHHALRENAPILIYSGLNTTAVTDPTIIEFAGAVPEAKVWNDWNDHELRDVFGAFLISTANSPIGSYLIFDTPDIAYAAFAPTIASREHGYIDVGGMRASRLVDNDAVTASLRLWNVVINGVAEDESQLSEIMSGLVKHLGIAIGALERS